MRTYRNLMFTIILTASLTCGGCVTTNHTVTEEFDHIISYDMEPSTSSNEHRLSKYVLSIEPLRNKRKMDTKNYPQFSPVSQANDWGFCSNFDNQYQPGIEIQISQLIAAHVNNKKLFKEVTYNNKVIADYYLTGDVTRFFGHAMYKSPKSQGISPNRTTTDSARFVGTQFGVFGVVIGEILAKTLETPRKEFSAFPVETAIELKNLHLYDRTGNMIKPIDDLKHGFYGDVALENPCRKIFQILDQQLEPIIEKLAVEIENSLN